MAERRLVECVANFSEGRDQPTIRALEDAVRGVRGAALLDRHSDPDHNRTVLTFAGAPEAVLEAALAAVSRAVELIDLNRHRGVHPRIGAADVVPFIPLRGTTMHDCAQLAWRLGARVWEQLGVPVYYYEQAAPRADRRDLAAIRRGEFERLRAEVRTDPDRKPDLGRAELHPTAGAVAIGARDILIAYNINLNSPDTAAARRIARSIRAASGGLAAVKALGVFLASRNRAQVTMNLTDWRRTPPHAAFEAVQRHAGQLGVRIAGSELVGLIPKEALAAGEADLQWENLYPGSILEDRITEVFGDDRIE